MAVNNIKYITQAIITLLYQGFKLHSLAGKNIYPDPPSKEKNNSVGFYLFHVQESAHHKNFQAPAPNQPAASPMGLNLYYQLTANFDTDSASGLDAYDEQEMLGTAMKILHDYPEINDNTTVNGTVIFPAPIQKKDNRIKISLLPVNYNESVHFWTAGQAPMKLSAYYEVSMIFLEPEEPASYAGRVLRYGSFIFTDGQPRITGSRSIISFTPPDEPTRREIVTQPAQVVPGDSVSFLGNGFSGDEIQLVLVAARDNQSTQITRGMTLWNLTRKGDSELTITIPDKASGIVVPPGLYSAQVKVVRKRTLPGGQVRSFENISNQFPFTVIPPVSSVTDPSAGGIVTVTGDNIGNVPAPDDVLVFVGEDRYLEDINLSVGSFKFSPSDTISINLKAGLPPGPLPVRIIISGAESPPFWINIL